MSKTSNPTSLPLITSLLSFNNLNQDISVNTLLLCQKLSTNKFIKKFSKKKKKSSKRKAKLTDKKIKNTLSFALSARVRVLSWLWHCCCRIVSWIKIGTWRWKKQQRDGYDSESICVCICVHVLSHCKFSFF